MRVYVSRRWRNRQASPAWALRREPPPGRIRSDIRAPPGVLRRAVSSGPPLQSDVVEYLDPVHRGVVRKLNLLVGAAEAALAGTLQVAEFVLERQRDGRRLDVNRDRGLIHRARKVQVGRADNAAVVQQRKPDLRRQPQL